MIRQITCCILFVFNIVQAQSISKLPPKILKEKDSLENLVNDKKEDTSNISRLNKLADLTGEINPNLSIEYAQKALSLGEKLNWQHGIAKASNCIQFAYVVKSDYINAIPWCLKAITAAQKAKDLKQEMFAVNALGIIYAIVGDYTKGLEYFQRLLYLNSFVNDKEQQAAILLNIGALYKRSNNCKDAIAYFLKSAALAKQINQQDMLISIYAQIGETYRVLKNSRESNRYLQLCLDLSEQNKTHKMHGFIYSTLAQLALDNKDYTTAVQYLNESNTYLFERKDYDAISKNYLAFSNIHENKMQYKHAIACVDTGLNYALKGVDLSVRVSLYKELSALYDKTLQPALAYTAYKNYRKIEDTLNAHEKEKSFLRKSLEINYKIKEATLKAEQDKMNAMAKQKLEEKKLQLNGIIFGSIVILLMLGLSINRYRRERSMKNLISQKNNELIEKTKQLEETNTVKNKLFTIISHDLRSPVASISSTLTLMELEDLSVAEFKEDAKQLSSATTATLNLLDNLLMWSMSQIHEVKLHTTRINMEDIANENLELYKSIADNKGVKLISHLNQSVYVSGDKNILNLVVRNLISNAIKFTPSQGYVELFSQFLDTYVIINIRDNGVGIDPLNIAGLFTLSEDKNRPGTDNEQGTGLGLALCSDLLHKMGDTITVQSEVGKGTTFSVQLLPAYFDDV